MRQGTCYYFETTFLTYSEASKNCGTKSGKLFEPQSVASNQDIYNLYHNDTRMFGTRWIGINRLIANGYRFNSNAKIPSFDMDHMWHAAPHPNEFCVGQSEDNELWYTRRCSNSLQSICEISSANPKGNINHYLMTENLSIY